MQLCDMAEIEKEEVEFPTCATLWQGEFTKGGSTLFLLFIYIVQLYKVDWEILRMLGCRAVALPGTDQIVKIWTLFPLKLYENRFLGPEFI